MERAADDYERTLLAGAHLPPMLSTRHEGCDPGPIHPHHRTRFVRTARLRRPINPTTAATFGMHERGEKPASAIDGLILRPGWDHPSTASGRANAETAMIADGMGCARRRRRGSGSPAKDRRLTANLDSSKESSHMPACVSTTTVIDRGNHGYRVGRGIGHGCRHLLAARSRAFARGMTVSAGQRPARLLGPWRRTGAIADGSRHGGPVARWA